MTAADLRRRHPSFLLLQDRNDLLFVEPASLHIVRLLGVGLYQKAVKFQGSTSNPDQSKLKRKLCTNKQLEPLSIGRVEPFGLGGFLTSYKRTSHKTNLIL